MLQFQPRSTALQVSDFLSDLLKHGNWIDEMPGAASLAAELGVNHKTVEVALEELEREGLLKKQGRGKPRKILTPKYGKKLNSLNIGILHFDQTSFFTGYYAEIQYRLQQEGHEVLHSPRTICELQHDCRKVARMVSKCQVDAWIVPGANQEILEWFAKQELPVFALAGRFIELSIPGIAPNKIPAMQEALAYMVKHQHQRIVLLSREARRKPEPGYFEQCFLKELESHGIASGSYNLPHWEENAAGFHAGLQSLFQMTPPTAIIVDQAEFIGGFLQFCTQQGLAVPRDVSLFCLEPDPSFLWYQAQVSHIDWQMEPFFHRIIKWIENINQGKADFQQSMISAKFIEGGTIGPAKQG